MTRTKSTFYLLLLPVLALAACATSENVPGAAVGPTKDPGSPTEVAVVPGGALAPAGSAADAVTYICEIGSGDPRAEVTFADLNATDAAKRELKQQIESALASAPSGPQSEVLELFNSDEATNAADTCEALEGIGDKPGDAPVAAGGGLVAAIESLGPDNTRANLTKIEAACADQACKDELAEFATWLEVGCASAGDCDDEQVALQLLHGTQPTEGQERLGICPVSGCPQTGLIQERVEEWQAEVGDGGEPETGLKPDIDDASVDKIVAALAAAPSTPLTFTEIVELVTPDCPDCPDTLDVLLIELQELDKDGAILDPGVKATVDALSANQPVDPAEAAVAFEFVRSSP